MNVQKLQESSLLLELLRINGSESGQTAEASFQGLSRLVLEADVGAQVRRHSFTAPLSLPWAAEQG